MAAPLDLPLPLRVLNMFKAGADTHEIAEKLGLPELEIARLLESGRDIDWARRQREAFEVWNASLKPVEERK